MIEIGNLEFTYQNTQKTAVKDMSFKVKEGEVYGFLGPSGAGKTTTQRLIIGLLRNYTGSIKIFGKERSSWGKEFYEQIGVAFDFPNLYLKLTPEENLKLIGAYYKNGISDIPAMLDRVGLLPDRNTRVESFSKGMKMRLNFIRSIMHNPKLMFFDEPTSGLDPVNAHIIKDIILEQKAAGKTIFLTTHNMTVAEQLCDRVSFIVDGKIVVTGSPADLMIEHGKRLLNINYIKEGAEHSEEFDLKQIGENEHFLNIIKNEEIRTIHTCEATLEDIFIKLTGKNLQ
ncbi:MAG: ATP-binding protein [Bacteroidetes bacterium GWE2_39_28]|nr:MAG: ATP-binding protein [Bacteroidetes bacterium GWE2_39_28]OFY16066.1 MAG: ATP-binding protein [Bacteroidetes bacterium GWF2_39_10]OFZ07022.1 MAG: ATP-binding protein [Bacteroidetes bacterium RIFOXYB2_FULL_39_7]HCT94374.1 ATP-binding protein [Rikenellaceae bacterium]